MTKQVSSKVVELKSHWPKLKGVLGVYKTERAYLAALRVLDALIDEIGENENHEFGPLAETIGVLVADYESRNFKEPKASSIETLKFLMVENGLNQSDLPEIGSQGVVSEVLSGRRELNKRQILALSKRFHVSPLVFFDKGDESKSAE